MVHFQWLETYTSLSGFNWRKGGRDSVGYRFLELVSLSNATGYDVHFLDHNVDFDNEDKAKDFVDVLKRAGIAYEVFETKRVDW